MAISATSASTPAPVPSKSSGAAHVSQGRSNAQTEKTQQDAKAASAVTNKTPQQAPKPAVVNTSGQTTGTRINTTA